MHNTFIAVFPRVKDVGRRAPRAMSDEKFWHIYCVSARKKWFSEKRSNSVANLKKEFKDE